MHTSARASHLSFWGRVVAASGLVVATVAIALAVLAVSSRETRLATYSVNGSLNGVMLDMGDADVQIVGGGGRAAVGVQRTDRFAFGHDARTRRSIAGGVFSVRSRCPRTILHACSVSYRVVVPDNVPVDVQTTSGAVRLGGFKGSARLATRSGDIAVGGFCGFSLQARSETGTVAAAAACAPQQLALRSTAGSVHAIVPPGRYQVDAESASGSAQVVGVSAVDESPFSIQASSSDGDVLVESGA